MNGISSVIVDELSSTVSIDHNKKTNLQESINTLHELGYPLFDEDNSLVEKAKSYLSCVVGRVKQKVGTNK